MNQLNSRSNVDLKFEILFCFCINLSLKHSPNFSTSNFCMLVHLINYLQGKTFRNREKTENAFFNFIVYFIANFFRTGIEVLVIHWQRFLDDRGVYFEENKVVYFFLFKLLLFFNSITTKLLYKLFCIPYI